VCFNDFSVVWVSLLKEKAFSVLSTFCDPLVGKRWSRRALLSEGPSIDYVKATRGRGLK